MLKSKPSGPRPTVIRGREFGRLEPTPWAMSLTTVAAFTNVRQHETPAIPTTPRPTPASWDVVGSSITVDLSSIESTLASLETGLDSTRNDISDAAQAQIDAIGANAYGEEYQGAWAPGAFAVGNVAYYDGMFYTCTVARTASNMGNPATATSSWDVADSSVTVDLGSIETMLSDLETEVGSARTDISDAIQAQIDAIGANAYGDLYKGEWAAGAFAIGDVVYHVGKFYECDVPRTSSQYKQPHHKYRGLDGCSFHRDGRLQFHREHSERP